MENGVTSLHFDLGSNNSTYHQGLMVMEFRNAVMETHHAAPQPTKVCAQTQLVNNQRDICVLSTLLLYL